MYPYRNLLCVKLVMFSIQAGISLSNLVQTKVLSAFMIQTSTQAQEHKEVELLSY